MRGRFFTVYRIGLTGGTAAGKSAAASILRELGAHLVTADEIAREQVLPGSPVLEALVREFGRGILEDDGTLDRRRLGAMVFADRSKLERLNAITHPPLVGAILERVEESERRDPAGVVVVDAALLPDWDIADVFDVVVSICAPADVRVARLAADGLSEGAARSRVGSQMSDEAYAGVADVVIEHDGSMEELRAKISELWSRVNRVPGKGQS